MKPATDSAGQGNIARIAYNEYVDAKSPEITEAVKVRRYYHGDQWTSDEVRALNDRKQPVVTYNYISQRINSIAGLVDRLRQDPKAYPRTQAGEQGAELASLAINYQFDQQRWREKHLRVVMASCIDGIGGVKMHLEKGDKGDTEIGFEAVDPEAFYYDPNSIRSDFSDASYMGDFEMMGVEDAVRRYPSDEDEIRRGARTDWPSEFMSKVDRAQATSSTSRLRVLLFNHWEIKDGAWQAMTCTYDGHVLSEGPSDFKDEKGVSICKFLMFAPFVDHQGDRYSFIRNMLPIQDEINQRRSRALYWINRRQIIAEVGAFDNIDEAREQAQRPDGVILRNKDFIAEFDRGEVEARGNMELMVEAKAEMEKFGPNDELGGDGGNDQSGRAIQLRQQAGIAKLGPYMIAFSDWKLRLYRAVWCAIKDHWQGERWLRVTDDEQSMQMVPVNSPERDEYGIPTGRTINDISALDVDIVLDEGPDQITAMTGTYDALIALANAGVPGLTEMIVEMSPLPSSQKKKFIQTIEQNKQQPDQAAAAEQAKVQQSMQIEQVKAQITMQADQAKSAAALNAKQQEAEIGLSVKQREGELALVQKEAEYRLALNAKAAELELSQGKSADGQGSVQAIDPNQIIMQMMMDNQQIILAATQSMQQLAGQATPQPAY